MLDNPHSDFPFHYCQLMSTPFVMRNLKRNLLAYMLLPRDLTW